MSFEDTGTYQEGADLAPTPTATCSFLGRFPEASPESRPFLKGESTAADPLLALLRLRALWNQAAAALTSKGKGAEVWTK